MFSLSLSPFYFLFLLLSPVLGLVFAFTEKYPDEPPFMKLESIRSLTVAELDKLTEVLKNKVSTTILRGRQTGRLAIISKPSFTLANT